MTFLGVNVGGTTCSVSVGKADGEILTREAFATGGPEASLARIESLAQKLVRSDTAAVGVSCGGPLDVGQRIILSPPNLPGWDGVPIVERIAAATGRPTYLMNDANAGALAEWYFGTGCRCRSLVFLTCGTGMGAGVIVDGRLLNGTSGMAGEVGHMRLTEGGPVGYGKAGSFEGWCSGGGFRQYAGREVVEAADAARRGDEAAREAFSEFGRRLGQGLAVLIDVLNPERIALGGIYLRCEDLLAPTLREVLAYECLPQSLAACEIVPATSGERIGDHAALAVARYLSEADPLDVLVRRFPELAVCRGEIAQASDLLCGVFRNGGRLFLCGNGGSWADCQHIAGELLKAFKLKRRLKVAWASGLPVSVADSLQGALPAIPLGSFGAFSSAFLNDVEPKMSYAQELQALAVEGDVLLALSTSGTSENVVLAAQVAQAKGLRVIGLTGQGGGTLKQMADICICVPERETYRVQELHQPVYHALCLLLENRFFGEPLS